MEPNEKRRLCAASPFWRLVRLNVPHSFPPSAAIVRRISHLLSHGLYDFSSMKSSLSRFKRFTLPLMVWCGYSCVFYGSVTTLLGSLLQTFTSNRSFTTSGSLTFSVLLQCSCHVKTTVVSRRYSGITQIDRGRMGTLHLYDWEVSALSH